MPGTTRRETTASCRSPVASRRCCFARMVVRRRPPASRWIPPCSSGPAAALRTSTSTTVAAPGTVAPTATASTSSGAWSMSVIAWRARGIWSTAVQVDPDRLFIHGGSAGGYVVLCAMTFHDVFQAGASLFGIADLEALFAHGGTQVRVPLRRAAAEGSGYVRPLARALHRSGARRGAAPAGARRPGRAARTRRR